MSDASNHDPASKREGDVPAVNAGTVPDRESDAVVVRRSSTEKRDTANATNGATATSTRVSFQFK